MFAEHVAGADVSAHTKVEVQEEIAGEVILRGWFHPFPGDPSLTTGTIWKRGIGGDYPVEVRRCDPGCLVTRWMTVEPSEDRSLRATVTREEELGTIPVVVAIIGPALDIRGVIQ